MADADDAFESGLIDLSRFSLTEIRSLDGTVLGEALSRVYAEMENPGQVVAGFDSAFYDPGP